MKTRENFEPMPKPTCESLNDVLDAVIWYLGREVEGHAADCIAAEDLRRRLRKARKNS